MILYKFLILDSGKFYKYHNFSLLFMQAVE